MGFLAIWQCGRTPLGRHATYVDFPSTSGRITRELVLKTDQAWWYLLTESLRSAIPESNLARLENLVSNYPPIMASRSGVMQIIPPSLEHLLDYSRPARRYTSYHSFSTSPSSGNVRRLLLYRTSLLAY